MKMEILGTNAVKYLDPTLSKQVKRTPLLVLEIVFTEKQESTEGHVSDGTSKLGESGEANAADGGNDTPSHAGAQTFQYHTDLENLEGSLAKIFDHAITCVQAIPQLEPSIMESLFWSHSPVLTSVHPQEERVIELREQIVQAVRQACIPAKKYLETFVQFEGLLNMDLKVCNNLATMHD